MSLNRAIVQAFFNYQEILILIDDILYRWFTNRTFLFLSFSFVTASLMLWDLFRVLFPDPVNWFWTEKNTYPQYAKWYVFFTQGFVERIVFLTTAYYNLRKLGMNAQFLRPFIVYNVWRIFEYWLFAFSIGRYPVILTILIISVALYGMYKPIRYTKG